MSIRLQGVGKSFGTPPTRVLTGIDLNIQDGEYVALTGRSGSGKSTLLYIMSSLDTPTSGTVELAGVSLATVSSRDLHRLRNQQIGFVFQFHYLLPELSALDNVLMPARKFGQLTSHRGRAEELLDRFGLLSKAHRLPRQLSGGEQQRVAIARSLVLKPRYLFADEPTGSLDTANGDTVMTILREINRDHGTTIILVTHEAEYAAQARRQVQLADGQVVADGVSA